MQKAWWTHPERRDIRLWRYMDLSKFASMLQSSAVHFARADQLGDPFEGSVGPANVNVDSYLATLTPKDLESTRERVLQGKWSEERFPFERLSDDERFRGRVEYYLNLGSHNREAMTREVYISCWHMNELESAAMWKLYSRSSDSVCVQVRFDQLFENLSINYGATILASEVTYVDLATHRMDESNAFIPLVHKRSSFSHERELRYLIWPHGNQINNGLSNNGVGPIAVPINLNLTIESIRVNPEAPEWFRSVVESLAMKYGLDAPVTSSSLNGTPLF
ncbi:DUF2971 domain-containing protein [Burkholderia sp. 3C]